MPMRALLLALVAFLPTFDDLAARRTAAVGALADARSAFDRYHAYYRPDHSSAPADHGAPIAAPTPAEIEHDVLRLATATSWSLHQARRDALRHEADAANNAGHAADAATLTELLALESRLYEIENETFALLQSENLLMRRPSQITRESLAAGADDLLHVPTRLLTALGDSGRWLAEPARRGALSTFLGGLLPLALALGIARRFLGRRIAHLAQQDLADLPIRTALLFAHLARTGCVAAFLWLAPLLARALLRDLPEYIEALASGLGNLGAGFVLGLSVNRELLRPVPAARMVLAVDRRTARRVGAGVTFLLWLSLGAFALQRTLTCLMWRNGGAIEALDLAYKIVAGLVVMYLLLQRALLMSLLPAADRPIGRLLRRLVALIHPVLVLLVPSLVVLQASGYQVLASLIARIGALLLFAFPLGSIAYQFFVFFLERWRDRALAHAGVDETALERVRAADTSLRFLLRVAVLLLVGAIVLQVTGTSVAQIRTFLDRPLPFATSEDGVRAVTWWNVTLALLLAIAFFRSASMLRLALLKVVLPSTSMTKSTQYTVATLTVYVVLGTGLWVSLNQIVDVKSLGYVVAALSVGIGFGLQEIISNFVSGLILLLERPIKAGDLVELGNGSIGTVREMGIRATTVQTSDNIHVLVPNREFITQKVVNYDHLDPRVRLAVKVGVASGSDPKAVRDALLEIAAKDGRLLERPAPEVQFDQFGDSSLDFRLLGWVADAKQQWRIASDLRFAIDAAFKRQGIALSTPQRELLLRAESPVRVVVEKPEAK